MFTGIVETVGRIAARGPRGGDVRLAVAAEFDRHDARVGESIAVNGVCLTVVAWTPEGFQADVSTETLSRTAAGTFDPGATVNLERALRPMDRLGGHLVMGHVDGVAAVLERRPDGRSVRLRFELPDTLARYVAEKGSITVDGVSLTVNGIGPGSFDVNIVPHTLEVTNFGAFHPGRRVNLEVDVVARYLERLLSGAGGDVNLGISREWLASKGYDGG